MTLRTLTYNVENKCECTMIIEIQTFLDNYLLITECSMLCKNI